jgi:hypothetical protein
MKSLKVTRGAFSAVGNLMLIDKKTRKAYFCPKSVVAEKGWSKIEDITFPLYVNVDTFTYNNLDDNNDPIINSDGTKSTFTREDVIDVFTSAQALAEDYADDFSLEILKKQAVKSTATSAGLTESNVNALLELAI